MPAFSSRRTRRRSALWTSSLPPKNIAISRSRAVNHPSGRGRAGTRRPSCVPAIAVPLSGPLPARIQRFERREALFQKRVHPLRAHLPPRVEDQVGTDRLDAQPTALGEVVADVVVEHLAHRLLVGALKAIGLREGAVVLEGDLAAAQQTS